MEEWRVFPDHPAYEVSSLGRVVNRKTGVERKPRADKYGYLKLNFHINGHTETYYLHRLVASIFIEGAGFRRIVRFRNCDLTDCSVSNLVVYSTRQERRIRRRGNPRTNAKRVRIVELDKVFRGATEAAAYIGGDAQTIYDCLRGNRISHKGYTFERVKTKEALAYYKQLDRE